MTKSSGRKVGEAPVPVCDGGALAYRPDIDGLRAIAVLVVVFFHAGLSCPGGFVGVDVFFVISGYLITGLLLRDLRENRFSLAGFWERRVRRIFPALGVMVLATLVAGAFLPSASEYAKVGWSAVAQSLGCANVFFMKQPGGYFSGYDVQPLLHTWSLAVEEQFYLFFPLLLLLCWRGGRAAGLRWVRLVFWVIIAASLSLAATWLSGDSRMVFYLLPARAWELACGAMLAVFPAAWFYASRGVREVVAWSGLAGILLPVAFYTSKTPFPGVAALPPCLGTMGLIWANAHGPADAREPTVLGRWLAVRPMVFIGMISYSFYLWHWPVHTFWFYGQNASAILADRVAPVVVALGLAMLSWRWVEVPFREKRLAAGRREIFLLAALITAVVLAGGGIVAGLKGMPSRMSRLAVANEEAMRDGFRKPNTSAEVVASGRIPRVGGRGLVAPATVLLWGDSHASHAIPAFSDLCDGFGITGEVIACAGTPPVRMSFEIVGGLNGEASVWFDAVLRHVEAVGIKNIILAARWSIYQKQDPQRLEAALSDAVRRLDAAGCRVWVLQDVPDFDVSVPKALMAETRVFSWGARRPRRTEQDHRNENAVIYRLAGQGLPAVFLDPAPSLLDAVTREYRAAAEGVSLYSDGNHLTSRGSRLVLLPLFRTALGPALATPAGVAVE